MNLPDTNIWLALTILKHNLHTVVRDWFASQSGTGSVLFCRATQQSLLRLLTTEQLMQQYDLPAFNNAGAWELMEGFFGDARIGLAAEPVGIEARWKSFATRRTASPKLWMDAYLAAFAVEGGHQLITADKAFTQFQKLNAIVLSKTATS